MNLNELIAESERPIVSHPGSFLPEDIARSRTLLPLLVKVIKNQQEALERIVDISLASDRPAPIGDSEFHAFKLFDIRGIARESLRLEDIK